jgi:hypothetical protein
VLLENDAWRARGEAAREYVQSRHEFGAVIDKHIRIYESLLRPG